MSSNKNTNPFVLVAAIHCIREPWLEISLNGYKNSWSKQNTLNFQFIDFYSNEPNRLSILINRIIEDLRWNKGKFISYLVAYFHMILLFPFRFYIPKLKEHKGFRYNFGHTVFRIFFPDLTSTLRWKKLSIIKFFLNNSQFEYLVIANPSSYINLSLLNKEISNSQLEIDYGGMVKYSADSAFVVGSFILISRKVASLMVTKRFLIPTHTIDDVAFGAFLTRFGIDPTEIKSVNLNSTNDFSELLRE